ncbi:MULTISPECIES: hypothetical protein [Ruminococcus]|uniref:hypothetical protein n=1 Tax=Ruminococcus sp. TaxID=41978 RepID=UPI0025E5E71B|nr:MULTISPECIES: hypothetical protein [Ruminococcus]
MLSYFFTDKNGKKFEIKNVLTAEISADVDVPADELVLVMPYDERFRNADMFEVYDDEALVFVGQADEIVSIVQNSGAIAKLSVRSLAGRLLDNEAEPVTYVNPAAKFIFERHLKPFGIAGYDGDEHAFMGKIKIEKGMTEWQVLEKFCSGRYGKSPRITGAGFALMCGTYGGAKPIVFGRNGVGYTSLREYIKPCKVISKVKLRTEEYGGYKSVIGNNSLDGRIKRVRYVNAILDNNAVKTADRMIENGNRQSFEIMIECPKCLCGIVGRKAVIDDRLVGKREGLVVKSIKYSLGKNGESTTVVLGKENGDVADELHN